MTAARTSAGDPARTLALLWRATDADSGASRRGPKPGLTVEAVVDAATALADRDGLDAVTMRRVADVLGVSAMAIYTYVPGKAELLDLMLDAAYAAMPRADTEARPWRDRLAAVAGENRALFTAHPWTAGVSTARPPLGPGLMAKYEHELAALDGLRLNDVTMDAALAHLLSFVAACAVTAADRRAQEHDSAMNDDQWWAQNAPLLARVFDEAAYPLAARVGSAAGAAHGGTSNPDHTYTFGLALILDGLAVLIDSPG